MKTKKYRMSFTTGGLFHQESVDVAKMYLENPDWIQVRKDVRDRNVLQTRTKASAMRVSREVCFRLRELNDQELELLVDGDHQEQAHLLWVAVCRRYRFLHEFASEVIRERFLTLRYDLNLEDFDAFFNAKMEWDEDLEAITSMTRNKLRQNLFRMLREGEFLSADHFIIPTMLSARFVDLISNTSSQDLNIFPAMESAIQGATP
jgi:hypothetical protein